VENTTDTKITNATVIAKDAKNAADISPASDTKNTTNNASESDSKNRVDIEPESDTKNADSKNTKTTAAKNAKKKTATKWKNKTIIMVNEYNPFGRPAKQRSAEISDFSAQSARYFYGARRTTDLLHMSAYYDNCG